MNKLELVGVSKEQALMLLDSMGCKYRISKEDGEYYVGTRDFVNNRYNLVIEDGVVVAVNMG